MRDVVIGMSDGLTVPFALAAGLSGAVSSTALRGWTSSASTPSSPSGRDAHTVSPMDTGTLPWIDPAWLGTVAMRVRDATERWLSW